MKLVIFHEGQLLILPMEFQENVYMAPGGMMPGYVVPEPDADKVPVYGEEFIRQAMYEGAEHSGSTLDFEDNEFELSWAVVPETLEESNHLHELCPRHGFNSADIPKSE